jgi:hypothetical protein
MAAKKGMTTNFFTPLSFIAVFGSGMGKNQDPGSGINIPDPQNWIIGYCKGVKMTAVHNTYLPWCLM